MTRGLKVIGNLLVNNCQVIDRRNFPAGAGRKGGVVKCLSIS